MSAYFPREDDMGHFARVWDYPGPSLLLFDLLAFGTIYRSLLRRRRRDDRIKLLTGRLLDDEPGELVHVTGAFGRWCLHVYRIAEGRRRGKRGLEGNGIKTGHYRVVEWFDAEEELQNSPQ